MHAAIDKEHDKQEEEYDESTLQLLMDMTLKPRARCLRALKRANGDSQRAAAFLLGWSRSYSIPYRIIP